MNANKEYLPVGYIPPVYSIKSGWELAGIFAGIVLFASVVIPLLLTTPVFVDSLMLGAGGWSLGILIKAGWAKFLVWLEIRKLRRDLDNVE